MCFFIKVVLPSLQFLATAALGAFAAWIAYNQWRTSKEKLRLDLYKQRYQVYQAFTKFLTDATRMNEMSDAPVYYAEISDAYFLTPDVYEYALEAREKAGELWRVIRELSRNAPADETKILRLIDKVDELRKWFLDQVDESRLKFEKYLSFPEKKIL